MRNGERKGGTRLYICWKCPTVYLFPFYSCTITAGYGDGRSLSWCYPLLLCIERWTVFFSFHAAFKKILKRFLYVKGTKRLQMFIHPRTSIYLTTSERWYFLSLHFAFSFARSWTILKISVPLNLGRIVSRGGLQVCFGLHFLRYSCNYLLASAFTPPNA